MLVVKWSPACLLVSGSRSKPVTSLAPSRSRIPATILRPVWYFATFRRSATPTAGTCPLWKKIPHRSLKECCPPHSCSDLSPVTLVIVMRYERNNPVSSCSGYNIYQFPFYTDSDMATTLEMNEITQLCPWSPLEGNGLP